MVLMIMNKLRALTARRAAVGRLCAALWYATVLRWMAAART